jgi:hypothetical protein
MSKNWMPLAGVAALAFAGLTTTNIANAANKQSILARMYLWSNATMLKPEGYTEAGYAQYYTPDAVLIIDGVEVVRGLPAFVKHFDRIKASGAKVQTSIPFETEFRSGNFIHTRHYVRTSRGGETACMLAVGHAELRKGKIAVLSLVRTRVDHKSPDFVDKCRWEDRTK